MTAKRFHMSSPVGGYVESVRRVLGPSADDRLNRPRAVPQSQRVQGAPDRLGSRGSQRCRFPSRKRAASALADGGSIFGGTYEPTSP
jgi:hypothetical protein